MNIQHLHFYLNNEYKFERCFPLDILEKLKIKGHNTKYSDETLGGGQAIFIDRKKGVLIAGSDHRKEGCAIGY